MLNGTFVLLFSYQLYPILLIYLNSSLLSSETFSHVGLVGSGCICVPVILRGLISSFFCCLAVGRSHLETIIFSVGFRSWRNSLGSVGTIGSGIRLVVILSCLFSHFDFLSFLFFSFGFLSCGCLSCGCLGCRGLSCWCLLSRSFFSRLLGRGRRFGLRCLGLVFISGSIGLGFFIGKSSVFNGRCNVIFFIFFLDGSSRWRVRLNYIILFNLLPFTFLFFTFVFFVCVRGVRGLLTGSFLDLVVFLNLLDILTFLVIFRFYGLLEAISGNLVFEPFSDLVDK